MMSHPNPEAFPVDTRVLKLVCLYMYIQTTKMKIMLSTKVKSDCNNYPSAQKNNTIQQADTKLTVTHSC